MEPEGSLPPSQVPATCPYPEPFSLLRLNQCISSVPRLTLWPFRNMVQFYGEEYLAPRPTLNLEYYPSSAVRECLFNIYSQLPSILETAPLSASWGRSMPWWQGPTCHGICGYQGLNFCHRSEGSNHQSQQSFTCCEVLLHHVSAYG